MKYSLVFLGTFLAATTIALPAPVTSPDPPPATESLTLRDTSVQAAKDKKVARQAATPANIDTGTDTDGNGNATDSDKSATDGITTDDGNPRKNRRALAVRRQIKRNARLVARQVQADANDTDTDGVDSSPSDDDVSDSDGEKKRHLTRALRLRKARRSANREVRKRQRIVDTTDDGLTTDNDGISTASENNTDNVGIVTSDSD